MIQSGSSQPPPIYRWYDRRLWVWLLLIPIPPLALVLTWINRRFHIGTKIAVTCLTFILMPFFIAFLLGAISGFSQNDQEEQSTYQSELIRKIGPPDNFTIIYKYSEPYDPVKTETLEIWDFHALRKQYLFTNGQVAGEIQLSPHNIPDNQKPTQYRPMQFPAGSQIKDLISSEERTRYNQNLGPDSYQVFDYADLTISFDHGRVAYVDTDIREGEEE